MHKSRGCPCFKKQKKIRKEKKKREKKKTKKQNKEKRKEFYRLQDKQEKLRNFKRTLNLNSRD